MSQRKVSVAAIERQRTVPLAAAVDALARHDVLHFDVPAHKGGRMGELVGFFGREAVSRDFSAQQPLDNLSRPSGILKESEQLAAAAFGADFAYFVVNGTTAAVQAMVFAVVSLGEEIILPRAVHVSAINALVLCGAKPVFVASEYDERLGIPLGMTVTELKRAIARHPKARAVFVNNPTYYGIASDLKSIVKVAHAAGMRVIVDEAHGAHLGFCAQAPISAMAAGADMAALSIHKTGGSLTQSSLLLARRTMDCERVRQVFNLTRTTSASYLLMSSLDLARRDLALNGRREFAKVTTLAEAARADVNRLGGYVAFGPEIVNGTSVFAFDRTKLLVNTSGIGLTGVEVYDRLRDEHGIQVEFGDLDNILILLSPADDEAMVKRVVAALGDIRVRHGRKPRKPLLIHPAGARMAMSPQSAFFAKVRKVRISDAVGRVSAESVMSYPPGIPVLIPGERVTPEALDCIRTSKRNGCYMVGARDARLNWLMVVDE